MVHLLHNGTLSSQALTTRTAGWSWDVYYTVPIALTACLFLIGFLRMNRRLGPSRARWVPFTSFVLGWFSLVIALNSPIHEIGEQLFWVHMTQHEILVLISAPLLVLSRPIAVFLWSLPRSWRVQLGNISKTGPVRSSWLFISAPLVAWTLHAAALWAWHVPALFSATVDHAWIHGLQHISFLGSALLFWWALLHGDGARLSQGAAILYVFTTAAHTSALGALLTFAPRAWYAPYLLTANSWGLSPLQDQQMGGLIMWIPSGTVLVIIGLMMVLSWMRTSQQRWEYTHTAAVLRDARGVHEM